MIPLQAYLALSAILFCIGTTGVLMSRNIIIMFMCIELMLNAANLAIIAFAHALGAPDGHIIVFLVLTLAAAEAAVGLAMIITLFRNRETVNVDRFSILKG